MLIKINMKKVIDLSPKLPLRPAWQELNDNGATDNVINSLKLRTSIDKLDRKTSNTPPKPGYSKLEYYRDTGLTIYRSTESTFKAHKKGGAILKFLCDNKNTPFSIEDIRTKCNPNIAIIKHHFKRKKDTEDTIRNIKSKLKVKKGEYFPILKRGGFWIWEEK